MSVRRRAAPLAVVVLLAGPVRAQEGAATEPPPAKRRPTIGLALEGGAAHGLAHIGVLEWLEAHRVPVDYLAGTSMGALVGGLYATGKSPAGLRDLIAEVEWDLVLSGTIPYRDLTFRRREDLRAYPNTFVLGLRHGLRLPPGLNPGQQITLLMDREALAYSEITTFDDLPVPFRCVATDLVTGKAKVFGDGPLPEALRATMSIPGLFVPVRRGPHLYADGGLVDNLPSDVVRQMGADVVIAVHLREKEAEAGDIGSMFQVIGRSMDLAVKANEAAGVAAADVVVTVDLTDFSAADYEKADTIIARGADAAREAAPRLGPYALDEAAWAEHRKAREGRRRQVAPVPGFVRVEGTDPRAARHLERFLTPFVGKAIDGKRLDRDLTRLSGIGKFSRVGYRVVREGGREGLLVTVEENSYAPPLVQLGFEVDGSEAGDVGYTLGGRLTAMDIGGYRSEWRTDLRFGSVYAIESEYYRPLTASSKWFAAPRLGLSSGSYKIFDRTGPQAEYRVSRAALGFDLGYGVSRFAQVRAGYELAHVDAELRLGAAAFPDVSGAARAASVGVVYDQTDDPVIPRRGAAANAHVRWYDHGPGASRGFPLAVVRAARFQPVSGSGSLFLIAEGGTTFGKEETGVPQFSLGGPQHLSAYGLNELRGNEYVFGAGGYLHDLWRLPPFVGKKVYLYGAVEVARMGAAAEGTPSLSSTVAHWPAALSAGLVAQTAFGPLLVGGSVGDQGHRRWFFRLGRVFQGLTP
jgi:NTE family protein